MCVEKGNIMEMNKIYDSQTCEKNAQQLWDDEKIYLFTPHPTKQTVSIDTPPPTVSGSLHIGHVFSYTHQDVIARYKRMRGFNVFYPMGFDDNGLPTERFVEKKRGFKAHMLKRSEFINICLEETALVEKEFEKLWRSLGLSIDWTKLYSTISDKARKISQHSFLDLYKKDFIYRKHEPALYCTTCRTSVSQAELDSADVTSTFNDITFMVDGKPVIIATTRPELLPACVAVFCHPDDTRYHNLIGKKATIPVFNTTVPVLADSKVDPEKGTGLVMCCTFGDQTDIYWFKQHKLPFIQAIGLDGKWTDITGPLSGCTVHEARKKIIELLQACGALVCQRTITHAVSTHERCKQEIEYQILSQWFVKILEYKQAFLDRGEQINWYPSFMKARYKDWVEHLNWDWCISRQRFFGIPFPAWHCNDCHAILLAQPEQLPIDPQEEPFPGGACPHCASKNITPDTDVMDTWNTSSLTPQINLNWPEQSPENLSMPMSIRPQAHDIIRTWAFNTIVKAHYHHNTIPWNDIVISGHVLAGKEKISKSKENSKTSPEALLQTYPADVIRYWSASARLGTDTAFSDNQLKIGQRLITKMWNALRFCAQHITDYQPTQTTPALNAINQWVLQHLDATVKQYIQRFDAYEYSSALECVEQFFWSIFCDNYLELVKDQFFNPQNYTNDEINGTRSTLYTVGFGILQLFSPFLPHITETLYQQLYRSKEKNVSIHTTIIDTTRYTSNFEYGTTLGDTIVELVGNIRKIKSENQLSLKADIKELALYSDNSDLLKNIQNLEQIIKGITKASTLSYHNEKLQAAHCSQTTEGLDVHLNV